MCQDHRTSGQGLPPVDLSRRRLLQVGGAAGASLLFSTALGTPPAVASVKRKKRAYVLVVDGCKPGEINRTVTPRLAALRAGGRNYPNANGLPILETLPNHVMMMTGVRPDRSGVPANSVYDRELGEVRELDRPSDLKFPTLISRLNRAGFTTGTVLSKEYLYGIFGDRATYRWEPQPIVPVSGHAPDAFTMDATISMVEEFDPDLVFVNLGDIDRMGHSDLTGTSVRAARTLALTETDLQVGRFVDMLKDSGRWRDSVVIVLADHSMDWSTPGDIINLAPRFEEDPLLAGNVQIADNGGADLLYWTGPSGRRADALARMREIALATPGVLSVRRPAKLRLSENAGDLIAFCKAGWRFSDPELYDNPIPGNHGHPATRPIPFFIGGGSRLVRKRTSSSRVARTIDVAPTVGRVFGLRAPRGGYDGVNRL
jgi:predicted AlkP superfamily pyrophosphatase or phosphodiesterase